MSKQHPATVPANPRENTMNNRTPARFADYYGDVTHIIGEVKGPNTLDEMLQAVTAVYDPETDRTRVGFAYGVPA
jgi:hypothetical protein